MNNLVAVVLLNYNQNDFTLKCIDSLLKSDYKNYKILLIDNGSAKNNVKELEKSLPKNEKLAFIKIEDNIGYGQGTNYGLSEGLKLNPDYFLIMNNDTIIDPLAIKELVKACKLYNDKARVTGKVYRYDEPSKFEDVGSVYSNKKFLEYRHLALNIEDTNQFEEIEERDMIDDVFVLQSAEFIRTLGGYSPYLWLNGVNVDLGLRALKNGFKLVYTPHAKLWHKGSLTVGGRIKNPKTAFWNIQSRLIIRYTYLSKINFIKVYINIWFGILRTFIKSIYLRIIEGKDIGDYAKAKYKGILYFHKWVRERNMNTGYNPYN